MPKLSDLLAEKAKADIQVGGATINFTYFAMWRERFSEEERQTHVGMPFRDYIKAWLPRVVISWDIIDDDGHAVPVTADAIEQHSIPDSLLLAFHARIVNSDLSGKVPTSSISPGT
jgi:hypothetical protein